MERARHRQHAQRSSATSRLSEGRRERRPRKKNAGRPVDWGQERPKEDKTEGRWDEKMTKLKGKENGNPSLGSEDYLILLALRGNNNNNH